LDATSREQLDAIIDRVRDLPVLLLITYRPEFTPPWASHPHATTLVLNRLGNREMTAMVDQVTGKRLSREVHRQIIKLSDGVPLFVEELVRTVLESGLLRELDDEYLLYGRVPHLAGVVDRPPRSSGPGKRCSADRCGARPRVFL